MFTPEQEAYLKKLADKGLLEEQEVEARNAAIEEELKVQSARESKLAELKQQADELINQGMKDFEENVVPTIK